jgi:hypothetical protein
VEGPGVSSKENTETMVDTTAPDQPEENLKGDDYATHNSDLEDDDR